MSKQFDKMIEDLKWLNYWIVHCRDQAEAKLAQVNRLLQQFGQLGFVNETVLLDEAIHARFYAPQSDGNSSGQVLQAALLVPGGFGLALWDSEEYIALRDVAEGLESEAGAKFVPFEKCSPALKALILPSIEPLLAQFFRRLPLRCPEAKRL